MIVRELDPPYREALIQIVLQALDVPWLKEKGSLTIRDDRVYLGDVVVAVIERSAAHALAHAAALKAALDEELERAMNLTEPKK